MNNNNNKSKINPEDYSVHVKEMTKFMLEQIFTVVTGEEVTPIDGESFMAILSPQDGVNAAVMIGQLQERLLSETLNILVTMQNSNDQKLEKFSHNLLTFITRKNLEMLTEHLTILPDCPSDSTSEVRH